MMCRIFLVKASTSFEVERFLTPFAEVCRNSSEYQGHGWGMAKKNNNSWVVYKNINPIWEDNLSQFGRAHVLLVHARSAFKDSGIHISYNMPFHDHGLFFAFNGELRGVRMKARGSTGAHKIFNILKASYSANGVEGVKKSTELIISRTRRLVALNYVFLTESSIIVNSAFTERSAYYTMYSSLSDHQLAVSSEPFKCLCKWKKIPNHTFEVLQ